MAMWLLDVNALVAIGWEEHECHSIVLARLGALDRDQWASCAITQLGFMRISSTPGLLQPACTPAGAREVLSALLTHPQHRFLSDPPAAPVTLSAEIGVLKGYRQITDAYLIALARHHRTGLLSFDRGMYQLATDVVELLHT